MDKDKDQEIERLNNVIRISNDTNRDLMRHIEGLDRQIAKMIALDNEKDDFILKIRKELISRL